MKETTTLSMEQFLSIKVTNEQNIIYILIDAMYQPFLDIQTEDKENIEKTLLSSLKSSSVIGTLQEVINHKNIKIHF